MQKEGIKPNKFIFLCILKASGHIGAIKHCEQTHDQIIRNGLELDLEVGSTLVDAYVKCRRLGEARIVFDGLPTHDVVSWGAMIGGFAQNGHGRFALELFERMQQEGIKPDRVTFVCILQACGSTGALGQGKLIHAQTIKSGLEPDSVIGNSLIDMYAKCGSLEDARKAFDELSCRNIVSWGAMITGYAQHGQSVSALELFLKLQEEGIKPNEIIFPCILKACGTMGALDQGKLMHDQVIRSGLEFDVVVGSTLIDMYAKCGSLDEANKVFSTLPNRNVVSWSVLIAGYTDSGHALSALELFDTLRQKGIKPTTSILLCVLKVCGSIKALEQGKLIHDEVLRNGLQSDAVVGSTLVDMYAKCGSLEEARTVFEKLSSRPTESWGVMIAGYALNGCAIFALELFEKMQKEGVKPDNATFLFALKACSRIGALGQVKLIHDEIVRRGLEADAVAGNTLVDVYAKCGDLVEARKIFDNLLNQDVVLWGTMIAGYAQHGHGLSAIQLFEKMQMEGLKPDKVTILCVLKACVSIGALRQGALIHDQITSSGLESDTTIGSTLIDLYGSCGSLEQARQVFDMIPNRDVVSWSAMIDGYAQNGHGLAALKLYSEMKIEGIKPNKVSFLCTLKACGSVGALRQGKLIHAEIVENGLEAEVIVGNALVDMYAKCGNLRQARIVFDGLPKPDVASWGTMITGYAQHGESRLAKQCLTDMCLKGLKPHATIYTSILSACGHAGQVEEGHICFKYMKEDCGIVPGIEQFNCMVDLLGHAGHLKEAEQMLRTMPTSPDIIGWMSLLSACRTHSNIELGRRCFNQVTRLGPNIAAGYMLMSSIYADCHMWDDFLRIQQLKKSASAWKKPGIAWIEVRNYMHEFLVGDAAHPENEEIYANLNRLTRVLKDKGHVPFLDFLVQAICNVEKTFFRHSDKMSSVSGLPTAMASALGTVQVCNKTDNPVRLLLKLEDGTL